MLTPSDVLRAAGLGVRLEIDEPLTTDWRRRYIDLSSVHYEQGERLDRMTDLANARRGYCVVLYCLLPVFGLAGLLVGRWWR